MWWNTHYTNGEAISHQFIMLLDPPGGPPNGKTRRHRKHIPISHFLVSLTNSPLSIYIYIYFHCLSAANSPLWMLHLGHVSFSLLILEAAEKNVECMIFWPRWWQSFTLLSYWLWCWPWRSLHWDPWRALSSPRSPKAPSHQSSSPDHKKWACHMD